MKVLAFACSLPAVLADGSDLMRAKQTKPAAHFQGGDHAEIRVKLNDALKHGVAAMPAPTECKQFSLGELHDLEQRFFHLRSPELFTTDLRAPKHTTLESLVAEVQMELAYVEKYPEVFEAVRDGKCAEIAMQWVHHLTAEVRSGFTNDKLPLLAGKGSHDHAPELLRKGHTDVAKALASRVTCQVGHDAKAVQRGTWEGFPAWPYEVTYNASGYGPYPFWTLGGGSGGSLSGPGTAIQTHWSSVLNAERLDHAACSTSALFGVDKPCTHLFLGSQYAYLFTQDQSHCCISSKPGYACHLTTMQRDFYKVFEYKGTVDNYVSEHGYYSGPVKMYSMHLTQPSNFWFWYVTDLDDKPIEQGEGPCEMYSSNGDRNCRGPPKMLFHQYDPASFSEATIDASVFDVPEVCQKTTQECLVKPTNFCGDVTVSV